MEHYFTGPCHNIIIALNIQEVAEKWVQEKRKKTIPGGGTIQEYKRVNQEESVRLADAFLAYPFLNVRIHSNQIYK